MAIVGFLLFRPDTLFTNVRVGESLEEAFAAPAVDMDAGTTGTSAEAMDLDDELTDPDDEAMEIDQSAEPEILLVSEGRFSGIGRYTGAGAAAIYEQDGQYVLRFEDDTELSNGPDLYVYVLPTDSYDGGDPPDFLDLGRLTGNQGSQNYQLPDEYDPEVHRTVLIWCLRFTVPFAAASLG